MIVTRMCVCVKLNVNEPTRKLKQEKKTKIQSHTLEKSMKNGWWKTRDLIYEQ